MRGGERLVKECSWMKGICSRLYHSTEKFKTFSCRCPSSVMVNNRFRSADYLPCQLPLGGSQELKRFWLIPFNEVHSLSLALLGSSLREGAKAASPLGSPSWRPLRIQRKSRACTIQRSTLPLRLAKCRLRRLLACIAPAGVSVSPFGLPAHPEVEPRALRTARIC